MQQLTDRVDALGAERDRLAGRVEELEKLNAEMADQLEGTAHPINLGRTSLARVSASNVNGGRGLDSVYYGVRNAFDGGKGNVVGTTTYSYWSGETRGKQWIEVRFESPVTVTGVTVDGTPARLVELSFRKGGGEDLKVAGDLAAPAHGVVRVRLHLQEGDVPPHVNEVLVRGFVPPGVKHEASVTPLIAWDESSACQAALSHYYESDMGPRKGITAKSRRRDDEIEVTLFRDGMAMARDLFNLRTSKHAFEAMVKLVPLK